MNELKRLLEFDPLSAAEDTTGERWGGALGLIMTIGHIAEKRKALRAADDTEFSNTVENYLRIARDEGFKEVLRVPFAGERNGEQRTDEALYVLFHETDGVLLRFDTYGGDHVNSATFYYNWRPSTEKMDWSIVSSGQMVDGVWVGYHDGREALRFHLAQLRQGGQFLASWKHRPFLWLLHYMDTKRQDYDYAAINAERIAMLPEHTQAVIRGEA